MSQLHRQKQIVQYPVILTGVGNSAYKQSLSRQACSSSVIQRLCGVCSEISVLSRFVFKMQRKLELSFRCDYRYWRGCSKSIGIQRPSTESNDISNFVPNLCIQMSNMLAFFCKCQLNFSLFRSYIIILAPILRGKFF